MLLIYLPALMMALVPDNDVWIPFIKHRGITHTLIFGIPQAIIVGGLIGSVATVTYQSVAVGIVLGMVAAVVGFLSHLVGDALTVGSGKYGINPLWPLSEWEFRIGLTNSGSVIWNQGLLFLGIGALLAGFSVVRSAATF
jgi:inner membrane protein